jgi:hypothetical protein
MEVAKRLKRDSKTKANNHQRLSQKSGWVMADNSLDKTNINNLNQNAADRSSWLLFIEAKGMACTCINWLRFVKIQNSSPLAT